MNNRRIDICVPAGLEINNVSKNAIKECLRVPTASRAIIHQVKLPLFFTFLRDINLGWTGFSIFKNESIEEIRGL